MNPGPSVLLPLDYSVGDLRKRVADINGVQQRIAEALAVKNGSERAERLKAYAHSDVFPARQFSLEELGKCGPSAVPTIREMLDDPAFADEGTQLIKALVQAGGRSVGEELHTRLQQNLAFWKSVGPSLSRDWWNEDANPPSPLRQRYSQTLQLIVGLEQVHYSPALHTVKNLRDFWRSLPQLNDERGLDQMAVECDRLIAQSQAK